MEKMIISEKPNYYAILPADVRYDSRLKANEKLLFAEITSLTNKMGYCYATNEYFATLYNTKKDTISRWISGLEKLGYLKRELIRDNSGQITVRHLYINTSFNLGGIGQISNRGIGQIVKDNNKDINNIYIVFDKWNSKANVINHKKISKQIEDLCNKALKAYNLEDILESFDRLDEAVADDKYFYDTKWSLVNFLKQSNGISNWMDEGQQWNNYTVFKNQKSKHPVNFKNIINTEIRSRKEL